MNVSLEPSAERESGARRVVAALAALGVKRIFSLSGNHIMPIYDALIGSGIELLHARHEAACVHMADAYARLTGGLGVALVTGGQGHTNACAALVPALAGEAPVLLLSGHASTDELGLGAFQELAQAAAAAPLCKAAWTAVPGDDLGELLARAAALALGGRRGPVQISLPFDLLQASTVGPPSALDAAGAAGAAPAPASIGAGDVARLLACLESAERPLIIGGPGLCTPAGRRAMQRLEAHLRVPVVGMESPRGINDPSLGAFAEVLAEADVIVLLGKPLDYTLRFGRPPAIAPTARFAVVEPDGVSTERMRGLGTARTALLLTATADVATSALLEAPTASEAASSRRAPWCSRVRASLAYRPIEWRGLRARAPGRLHPFELGAALQRFVDRHPDTLLVCDGGEIGQWVQATVEAPMRLINGTAGSIGPALPFALAACAARRDAADAGPVLAVMGDGTAGFHIAELDTAVRCHLPVLMVVGNDARWNAEYQIQLREYGAKRTAYCELRPTRYDQVGAGFGAHAEHVEAAEQLDAALDRAWHSGRPACVNVMIESHPAPVIRRPAG